MTAFADIRARLEALKASGRCAAPPTWPTAPPSWTFDGLAFDTTSGQVSARVGPPWGGPGLRRPLCADCGPLRGHVRNPDGYLVECPSCAPGLHLARRVTAARLDARHVDLWQWPADRLFRGPSSPHRDSIRQWFDAACEGAAVPAMVFTGATGRGKTTVAAWLAWQAIGRGLPTRWVAWPRLLDTIRETFGDRLSAEAEVWRDLLITEGLLVVDDLGRHSQRDWAKERTERLLDTLPPGVRLLATTNAHPDAWSEWFGDAAASRLVGRTAGGQCVAIFDGPDMRRTA